MKQRQMIMTSNNNNMRNPIIKDVGSGYDCWMPLSSAIALYCTFFLMRCFCLHTIPLTSCNAKGNSATVTLRVGKLCPHYCLIP